MSLAIVIPTLRYFEHHPRIKSQFEERLKCKFDCRRNYRFKSPCFTRASRQSFNICKCFSLSCLIIFQTSTSLALFSFWASLIYVSTVECRKLTSIPNATRILYVELSTLVFSLCSPIQFRLQQS